MGFDSRTRMCPDGFSDSDSDSDIFFSTDGAEKLVKVCNNLEANLRIIFIKEFLVVVTVLFFVVCYLFAKIFTINFLTEISYQSIQLKFIFYF